MGANKLKIATYDDPVEGTTSVYVCDGNWPGVEDMEVASARVEVEALQHAARKLRRLANDCERRIRKIGYDDGDRREITREGIPPQRAQGNDLDNAMARRGDSSAGD